MTRPEATAICNKCRCGQIASIFRGGTGGQGEYLCYQCAAQVAIRKKEPNIRCPHCGEELQITLGVYL